MVLSYNMSGGGGGGYKGIIVLICLMKNQRNASNPVSHKKSMVTRLDPDLPDSTEATSNYHSEGNKRDNVLDTVPNA